MKAELEKIYHLGQAVRGSHGFFMEYYGKVTCRQKNKKVSLEANEKCKQRWQSQFTECEGQDLRVFERYSGFLNKLGRI